MSNTSILPEAFNSATWGGIWRPVHLKSSFAKRLYQMYTFLSITLVILLLITQIMATIIYSKNVDDFTDASFTLISLINDTVKGINIILCRTNVANLTDKLLEKIFTPQTKREKILHLRCKKITRYSLIYCMLLAEGAVVTLILEPLVLSNGKYELPLKAWYPFNVTSRSNYLLSYAHQIVSMLLGGAYTVSVDLIMTGLMWYITMELDFIIMRLQELSWKSATAINNKISSDEIRLFEKETIKKCIKHHLAILRFAKEVNTVFAPTILIQFLVSSIVLGVTSYQLSIKQSDRLELMSLVIYMIAVLTEFFLYCWIGNEVTYKSLEFSNAICEIEWTTLHIQTLKELQIMMIRSTSPIVFSCGPLIQLSLDNFTKILKLSYSALNLLKSTS